MNEHSLSFYTNLEHRWRTTKSMLCVGLDPDERRIPSSFGKSPEAKVENFCRTVVEVCHPFVCAFKPQIAYFSAIGCESVLERIVEFVRTTAPGIPVILDAKRNDIGSTSEKYAQEAFERYKVDALTVNAYLGWDTIEPFLAYPDKGVIVLCRTSNPGGDWLQVQPPEFPLYMQIAQRVIDQQNPNVMLVVGATTIGELAAIRELGPNLTLLVPGVGTQGGDEAEVLEVGRSKNGGGLVVNVSRAILYSDEPNGMAPSAIAERARSFAKRLGAYA